ncbi:MAG TPA: cytochrome C, partial [Desulfobacteria bacterium]|nr:cytochrome C [Desulfobacteria bacterium]
SVGAAYAFLNSAILYQAPYAVAPTDYNRSEASSDTRVAYGKFTDMFCVNCHDLFHSTFANGLVHPVGQTLSSAIRANYNSYVKSGDMTGTSGTAYLSLVPFQEDNQTNLATLLSQTTKTDGAVSGSEKVTCLSCHRAHASGFDSMLRYSVQSTFVTINGAYPDMGTNPDDAMGRTVAEMQQAYYDRPASTFASYQRVLCNKCHAKD